MRRSSLSEYDPTAHRLRGRRWRRRLGWAWSLIALFAGLVTARATSVTPPSFSELVSEAQVIAQGTVMAIDSRWVGGPQGPMIKTFVTFAVDKRLKGDPAASLTLEFLGGTVGGDTLRVAGMPTFKVGESEILFVRDNGVQFCPLVRLMHGRYHVRTDTASHRKYVARDDDAPLTSVNDVQLPADDQGKAVRTAANALAPEDFETQVTAEVARRAN